MATDAIFPDEEERQHKVDQNGTFKRNERCQNIGSGVSFTQDVGEEPQHQSVDNSTDQVCSIKLGQFGRHIFHFFIHPAG